MIEIFLLLIFGHFLMDYPLQGDFLARGKNRHNPLPGVPWYHALGAHAVLHGGAVGIITGVWWLGVLETALHAVTDDLKCAGKIGYSTDQFIHIACKALYIGVLFVV